MQEQALELDNETISGQYYWQSWGMDCDPFGAVDTNFISSETQDAIDLLQHLTQYSTQVKLVVGAPQSGKSTLLHQFIEHSEALCRCYVLPVGDCATSEELMHEVKSRLGVGITELGQTPAMVVEELKHDPVSRVMVIDDAHELTDEVLDYIKAWADEVSSEMPNFHFLLLGDESLKSKIDSWAQCVTLAPLSFDSVRAYLSDRLERANFSGEFPFSERELKELMKASQGQLSTINQAARLLMMERLLTHKNGSFWQHNRWLLLLLGLVVIVGSFVWQFRHMAPNAPLASDLALPEPQLALDEDFIDEDVLEQQEQQQAQLLPMAPRKRVPLPAAAKSDEVPVAEEKATQTPPAPEPEQVLSALPEPQKEEVKEVVKEEAIVAEKPTKPSGKQIALFEDASVVKHQSAAIEPDRSELNKKTTVTIYPRVKERERVAHQEAAKRQADKDQQEQLPLEVMSSSEKSIMAKNREHYTIQLLGSRDLDKLKIFVNQHGLKQQVTYVQTRRGESDWYVLLYGSYPTVGEARLNLKKLPELLQRSKPWLRQFGQLQKMIQARLQLSAQAIRT